MSPQAISLTSSVFLPLMVYRRPSFSVLPVVGLYRDISGVILPETTFTREYLPYWSEMVLNTMAAVGPLGSRSTVTVSSPDSSVAVSAGISSGAGTRSTMVCSSISVPRPVKAEPHTTGARVPSWMPTFRPFMISSLVKGSPEKNFSMFSSVVSATASISWSYSSSTTLILLSGMGISTRLPFLSGGIWYAFLFSTSMMPMVCLLSSQMGATTGAMDLLRFSRRASRVLEKLAFSSSSLEMYTMQGLFWLRRYFQHRSAPTLRPSLEAHTSTPTSAARTPDCISPAKSKLPGASSTLIFTPW